MKGERAMKTFKEIMKQIETTFGMIDKIRYSKRNAIRQARIDFGVVGKHFTKIEC